MELCNTYICKTNEDQIIIFKGLFKRREVGGKAPEYHSDFISAPRFGQRTRGSEGRASTRVLFVCPGVLSPGFSVVK